MHDGKTTPEGIGHFLDQFVNQHINENSPELKKELETTKIDPEKVARLQLNWIKENVKENPHAKEMNSGKTADDVLQKTIKLYLENSSPIISMESYRLSMQQVMEVDRETMKRFVDFWVKEKFQDTEIFKVSDIIRSHIEWAKLHDHKNIYALSILEEPKMKTENVLKLIEKNLMKYDLNDIIEQVLPNDDKYRQTKDELERFIYKKGGNFAEDPLGNPWNSEKVGNMLKDLKTFKIKNCVKYYRLPSETTETTGPEMIRREQFNLLLPQVFGVQPELVEIMNKEIGDNEQFFMQNKHILDQEIQEIK